MRQSGESLPKPDLMVVNPQKRFKKAILFFYHNKLYPTTLLWNSNYPEAIMIKSSFHFTKTLVFSLAIFILVLAGTMTAFADPAPKQPNPNAEREQAVQLARQGQPEFALTTLRRLYATDKSNPAVARDLTAVLAWGGHDAEAIQMYETMPPQQPDYVLAAIGRSYRNLQQNDKALDVYKAGAQQYPDSAVFVEGELRCLFDLKNYGEVIQLADQDIAQHGARGDVPGIRDNALRLKQTADHNRAVNLAREKRYADALEIFRTDLDAAHSKDPAILRDYMAILSWTGAHEAQVIAIYKSLPAEDQKQDYVLEAAAKSYRAMRQYQRSLELYREGERLYPNNGVFANGEVRVLNDMGHRDEAEARAKTLAQTYGNRRELLGAVNDIEKAKRSEEAAIAARATAQANAQAVAAQDNAHVQAVQLAREGRYEEALAQLNQLALTSPNDMSITRDRVAVMCWSGKHDSEAVNLFHILPAADQPNYVIEAVALAYRNLHSPHNAATLYELGLSRTPDSQSLAVGLIRSLSEDGFVEKAIFYADSNLRQYGDRLEVLLAAADAADQYNMKDAFRYYNAAYHMAPQNRAAILGLVRTYARQGQVENALQLVENHPGVLPAAELRQLQGDEAALLVRRGSEESQDTSKPEKVRFATTDRAITRLNDMIAAWANDQDAARDVVRARQDRMLALYNRYLMTEVIQEYQNFKRDGLPIPAFLLGAVGDAYLELHEPEKARDIFLQALKNDPKNYTLKRQLFYAYVESDDDENAYRIADEMAREQNSGKAAKYAQAHSADSQQRRSAELTAGAARMYFGEVQKADARITPVVAQDPNTAAMREAMGNIYAAHGWLRQSLQQYEMGNQLAHNKDISNQVGIISDDLALQHFPEAEQRVNTMLARDPENQAVQRAARDWNIHNMAELDVRAGFDGTPLTSRAVNGGRDFGVDTLLYSPPVNYNWRLFAGDYYTHQKEPNQEGSISYNRGTAGIEYRNGPYIADLAPTLNHYKGNNRIGASGDLTKSLNDYWTIAAAGELFAREVPLRALNSGVTANSVVINATWKANEEQSLRFGGNVMPFSDGNTRVAFSGDYVQRIQTYPHLKIDGLASVSESQNTADTNRVYYNPARDAVAIAGPRVIQTLYTRYSTLWQHSLQVMPGIYWEQSHGENWAARARYEQRLFLGNTFEMGIGGNWSHQAYDKKQENDLGVTLDLTERF